jgi:hypothetical protein
VAVQCVKGAAASRAAIAIIPTSPHHLQHSLYTLHTRTTLRLQPLDFFALDAVPPFRDSRTPATPANSRASASLLTSVAPHRTTPAPTLKRLPPPLHYARGCGAEERAGTCLRHRRQSHGRRAEARPVPRLVSCRDLGRPRTTPLTTTQASQDRVAAQGQPQQTRRHYRQYQTRSAPSRTAMRQATQP